MASEAQIKRAYDKLQLAVMALREELDAFMEVVDTETYDHEILIGWQDLNDDGLCEIIEALPVDFSKKDVA